MSNTSVSVSKVILCLADVKIIFGWGRRRNIRWDIINNHVCGGHIAGNTYQNKYFDHISITILSNTSVSVSKVVLCLIDVKKVIVRGRRRFGHHFIVILCIRSENFPAQCIRLLIKIAEDSSIRKKDRPIHWEPHYYICWLGIAT